MVILKKALVKCICLDRKNMKIILFAFILFTFSAFAQSQIELDPTPVDSTEDNDYFIDYSNQLLLKVMTVVKSNNQQITNTNNYQSIKLKPAGTTSLGVGFNYKWLGLGIAFGLPTSAESDSLYGKTKRFDFQLNIYSKKFVVDAFAQQYKGMYIENPKKLTAWTAKKFPQRDSMQTNSVGVAGFYVFNNKKLSYKAAYVRNAVQKKSAGSFLLGGYYNIDYAGFEKGATSFFVPNDFPQEVKDTFAINTYKSNNYGISFGYTYTFVFKKKWFINLTVLPGVGAQNLIVYNKGIKDVVKEAATRVSGRVAVGYENNDLSVGLTSFGTTGSFEYNQYEIEPSTENIRFFIAKRFNVKKKK